MDNFYKILKAHGLKREKRSKKIFLTFDFINLFFRVVEEQKRDDDDEDEDDDAKAQFADLKNALSGMKVAGNPNQGLPQQNKPPVDTPLNTQVEGVIY